MIGQAFQMVVQHPQGLADARTVPIYPIRGICSTTAKNIGISLMCAQQQMVCTLVPVLRAMGPIKYTIHVRGSRRFRHAFGNQTLRHPRVEDSKRPVREFGIVDMRRHLDQFCIVRTGRPHFVAECR